MTDDVLKELLEAIRSENAAGHAETRREVAAALVDVRHESAAAHAETRQEVAAALVDVRNEFAVVRSEFAEVKRESAATRDEFAAAHADLRHLFQASLEQMKSWFNLLAEGIKTVDEKVDRRTTALDQKIDQTAAETQSLIKFLYDELNRRVLTLEGKREAK
jgi:hypothetical protein